MWDDAPLLRGIANGLFGVSLLLLLYGIGHYVLRLPVFALRTVELSAVPQRVPTEAIASAVREQVSGNFFTMDLERMRRVFERLPWVRKVDVRRKFPWGLEVQIEEQVVLARWNGTELVNTHGEVFEGKVDQVLPAFIGQSETSVQVTQMYGELGGMLAPLHRSIDQISLSPRHAWQVKLDDGMVIELGRTEMQQRMARFVAVYPYSLAAMSQAVRRVDLRYRSGFAVYLPGRQV